MWNFRGSWFLTLEFPGGVRLFCKIFNDDSGNLDPYLADYSLKQSRMEIFYVFFLNFPVDWKLENRRDKV